MDEEEEQAPYATGELQTCAPVSVYTRAMAIADGVLVELMGAPFAGMAAEAGFTYPLAMTQTAFATCVAMNEHAAEAGCDEKGRLWDVLMVCSVAMRCARAGADEVAFSVACVRGSTTPEVVALKVVCGPGDDGEPVLTIMLREED